MVTKAWKVMTPSVSKKNPTVRWNWSNESDGTRVFEAFNSDLTGHPTYTIIRITRNTEAECNAEMSGQITDGYFEDYCGTIRSKEVNPDKIRIKDDLAAEACRKFFQTIKVLGLTEDEPRARLTLSRYNFLDTICVLLRYYGLMDELNDVWGCYKAVSSAEKALFGWEPCDTPENREAYLQADRRYLRSITDAFKAMAKRLNIKEAA